MATADHIRNPIEWSVDQIKNADVAVERAAHGLVGSEAARHAAPPVVQRIGTDDIKDALAKGFSDFAAYRTDVIFLCIIYPLAGAILARFAFGYGMLPLIFPLASGFALIGPVAAIGLYEMSRRREQGHEVGWGAAFGVVKAPAFGAIFVLGLLLLVIFLIWLGVALGISAATIGTEKPASIGGFVRDVLGTGPGWAMIVVGISVGFCFAVLVMAISVVSFPLLLDRGVGLGTAIATSARVVRANPGPMALWGLIVAVGLVIGAIPLLIGLVVVMPVLGHATWHLYRKVVAR